MSKNILILVLILALGSVRAQWRVECCDWGCCCGRNETDPCAECFFNESWVCCTGYGVNCKLYDLCCPGQLQNEAPECADGDPNLECSQCNSLGTGWFDNDAICQEKYGLFWFCKGGRCWKEIVYNVSVCLASEFPCTVKQKAIEIELGESSEVEVYIKNTGSVDDTYWFETYGYPKALIDFSGVYSCDHKYCIDVQAQEIKTVYLSVDGSTLGTHHLTITANSKSKSGVEDSVDLVIRVIYGAGWGMRLAPGLNLSSVLIILTLAIGYLIFNIHKHQNYRK